MYIRWFLLLLFINIFKFARLKKVKITVTSINCALDQCKDCGSEIIIDSKHRSQKLDGINMAIVSPFTGHVMSSASFSSSQSEQFNNFLKDTKTGYVVIATSQLLCTQEKTTNVHKQKAILFAFEKLGANLPNNIQAVVFRSGVYIFCKQHCFKELRTNIKIPLQIFKRVTEDPILISFTMDTLPCRKRLGCKPVPTPKGWKTISSYHTMSSLAPIHHPKKKGGISLMLIAAISPLFVVGLISLSVFLYIRHKYKKEGLKHYKAKKTKSKCTREKQTLNENAIKFCECRKNYKRQLLSETESDKRPLVYESVESGSVSSPKTPKHTESFRLFHQTSDPTEKPRHKHDFATYVSASDILDDNEEHTDDCIYKVPSSIRRHAPPQHLPPICDNHELPEEYVDFSNHDYASLDDVGFISSPTSLNDTSDSDVFITPENSNGDVIDPAFEISSSLTGYDKAKELYERASLSLSAMSSSHLTSGLDVSPQQLYEYEENYVHPI